MTEYRKEFRRFFTASFLRGLVAFVVVLGLFLVFRNYVNEHYEAWVAPVRDKPVIVYTFFFINELVLGLIPPEFFMFLHVGDSEWVFWQYVTLMCGLSYAGGMLAFYFGKSTRRTRFMRKIIVSPRARQWVMYYHKFGGILILIAAITPVPFALTSLLSGALDYDFKSYLKYASVRFLRFYPYAYAVYYLGQSQLF